VVDLRSERYCAGPELDTEQNLMDHSGNGTSTPGDRGSAHGLDRSALSSLSASLAEVTERLGQVARAAGVDDDGTQEVLEVERQLQTAGRRLEKVLRRLDRP
jgi:hypothetical protein